MNEWSDEKISKLYGRIIKYHKKYLASKGVVLPSLKTGGKYTKDALTLVYLAQGYPNTKIVSKRELTEFIRAYYPEVTDVQQARHLAAQKGWFIISGTRKDNTSYSIKSGEYKLVSLKEHYPGFTAEKRRTDINLVTWESLKRQYDYRCACCGSKEGEPHRYWKNTKTVLQQGHKDPRKALKPGNIIPQCEKCNRPDQNYWIYDDKGRVVSIANEAIIDSCDEEIQKAIYARLYKKFQGKSPKEI